MSLLLTHSFFLESKPEVVDLNRKRKRGNSSGDEEDEVSCKRMRIRNFSKLKANIIYYMSKK